MLDNELQQLIEIREYLIYNYKKLDGSGNPGTSVMLQKDTAKIIEQSIKRLDKVLSRHVEIK